MNVNRLAAASTEKSFWRGARMRLHEQILPRHTLMASGIQGFMARSAPHRRLAGCQEKQAAIRVILGAACGSTISGTQLRSR